MPITILQNLGEGKAIVLINDIVVIPTSNASGAYSSLVNLPKVILLGAWFAFDEIYYASGVVDTFSYVQNEGSEYYIHNRMLNFIDKIRIGVYQTSTSSQIVKRQYFVLGVMSV